MSEAYVSQLDALIEDVNQRLDKDEDGEGLRLILRGSCFQTWLTGLACTRAVAEPREPVPLSAEDAELIKVYVTRQNAGGENVPAKPPTSEGRSNCYQWAAKGGGVPLEFLLPAFPPSLPAFPPSLPAFPLPKVRCLLLFCLGFHGPRDPGLA
jgi:hypothetical protein